MYPQLPGRKKMQQSQQSGRLVDLSHTIEAGLITYKGVPAPIICDYLSRVDSRQQYAAGTEFQIGKLEMVGNTGTYIDCPFHRYADGKDISEVDLSHFAEIQGLVVRVPFTESLAITSEHFKNKNLRQRAVLVHTGWANHWNTELYYEQHPYLTEEAAVFLRDAGVKLVGIDSYNIDNTAPNSRPVHSILLASEILIVEHLCNLENLPEDGFYFNAIPPKIKGMGTFPVRAFARIN
jgi:arylformamidase